MSQHLSDEAVAAFADGVLTGHARSRATRHTAECPECATAVRVQREAAFALRAAPAPALPTDLFERLCGLPQVTPVHSPPTVVMPDGTTMLATRASAGALSALAPAAAFVAPPPAPRPHHRLFATSAAVVALAGALTAGAALGNDDEVVPPGTDNTIRTVQHRTDDPGVTTIAPASLFGTTDVFRTGGR